MKFKNFLINENRAYLAEKVGDILNAVENLVGDASAMGSRHLLKNSEKIASGVRRILHSNWPPSEGKHLRKLQKVAVAILKAIDDGDELKDVMSSVQHELHNLMNELGSPINQLGSPDAQLPDSPKPGPDIKNKKQNPKDQQGQSTLPMQQAPQTPPPPGLDPQQQQTPVG